MTMDEIEALPIKSLFRGKNGAVFLWATCPRIDLAMQAHSRMGASLSGVLHSCGQRPARMVD